MNPWLLLERRVILDRPPWLRLEEHHLRLPDGREIPEWLWIATPDFVNVVAIDAEGMFLCFRQRKYAMEGVGLALVGGYVEPGEDTALAAARELREETGHESADWKQLGSFAVDGNRGCGRGHFYLARGCRTVAQVPSDDLEDQELLRLSRSEVLAALRRGEFGVMPWSAALALALLEELPDS